MRFFHCRRSTSHHFVCFHSSSLPLLSFPSISKAPQVGVRWWLSPAVISSSQMHFAPLLHSDKLNIPSKHLLPGAEASHVLLPWIHKLNVRAPALTKSILSAKIKFIDALKDRSAVGFQAQLHSYKILRTPHSRGQIILYFCNNFHSSMCIVKRLWKRAFVFQGTSSLHSLFASVILTVHGNCEATLHHNSDGASIYGPISPSFAT